MTRAFYGWRIVAACMLIATVSWSLGTFGMGVWIFALTTRNGFSLGDASTAVTLAYVVSAVLTLGVGSLTARHGPQPVVAVGVVLLAIGVSMLPGSRERWQLLLAFLLIGCGMSAMSTTLIGTTLAPWFERFQGRAMSTAMLGASIGGIVGTPVLMAAIATIGFGATAAAAAGVAVLLVWPVALFVLKRRPQDIGLLPDGATAAASRSAAPVVAWSRSSAVRTPQFQTQVLAFGIGLMVQIGFLSHHVSIALSVLGAKGAAVVVSAAAVAAFAGRILLARYVDRIDPRRTACGMFMLAAVSLSGVALFPTPVAMMGLSVVFGLTVGNVTTLAPIVIRREFGAASFGQVFGLAATFNQLALALGPALFGILHDAFGSYAPVLMLSSVLDLVAAVAVMWGGRRPIAGP